MLRVKGNYTRNQNQQLLQGIILEETKNCKKNLSRQKAGEQWLLDEQCKSCEKCCRNQISQVPFSSIFCYSFFLFSDLQC